jgi:coenzyme F420-reducing hydrogenase delta subunit
VVEYLLRAGAAGVLVLSCPPRDCWNREGVKWLEARLFHEREAELQERVDRRRLRVAALSRGERARVTHELEQFRAALGALERPAGESDIDLLRLCDPAEAKVAR